MEAVSKGNRREGTKLKRSFGNLAGCPGDVWQCRSEEIKKEELVRGQMPKKKKDPALLHGGGRLVGGKRRLHKKTSKGKERRGGNKTKGKRMSPNSRDLKRDKTNVVKCASIRREIGTPQFNVGEREKKS